MGAILSVLILRDEALYRPKPVLHACTGKCALLPLLVASFSGRAKGR